MPDRLALHEVRAPHDYADDIARRQRIVRRAEFMDRVARVVFLLAAAVVVVVWLAGCALYIEDDDIEAARNACEPFGGLLYMSTHRDWARCKDGTAVEYRRNRRK